MELITIKDALFVIIVAIVAALSYRHGNREGWVDGQSDLLGYLVSRRLLDIEEDEHGNVEIRKGD